MMVMCQIYVINVIGNVVLKIPNSFRWRLDAHARRLPFLPYAFQPMELLFSPGITAFFLQLLCCPQSPSPAMYFSAHWSLTHPSNPLQFLPLPTSVRPLRPHSQELVSSLHTGYFISFLPEIFVLCHLLGHLPDCFSIRSKHLECPIKLSGQSFIS